MARVHNGVRHHCLQRCRALCAGLFSSGDGGAAFPRGQGRRGQRSGRAHRRVLAYPIRQLLLCGCVLRAIARPRPAEWATATLLTRSRGAGHLSDKWGRRPLLLLGIGACFVLLGVFGLSTTIWIAIGNRLLEGALNSNIPVAKVRGAALWRRSASPSRAHPARPGVPVRHHTQPGAPGRRVCVHGRCLRVRALPTGPPCWLLRRSREALAAALRVSLRPQRQACSSPPCPAATASSLPFRALCSRTQLDPPPIRAPRPSSHPLWRTHRAPLLAVFVSTAWLLPESRPLGKLGHARGNPCGDLWKGGSAPLPLTLPVAWP